MSQQEKKKGNYSKLVYRAWVYDRLKENEPLFLSIGRRQIKGRHGCTVIYCSNSGQQDDLMALFGRPISIQALPVFG
jgi:hypothetical protein